MLRWLIVWSAVAWCGCHHESSVAIRYPAARAPSAAVACAVGSLPEPDRAFVREASDANAAATRLGRLAIERGESERVRALGREMVDRHTELADRLRQTGRYEDQPAAAATMTADEAERWAQLSSLRGPAFDAAFLQAMAQTQRRTLDSFSREAALGRDPELRQVARESLPRLRQQSMRVEREIQIL